MLVLVLSSDRTAVSRMIGIIAAELQCSIIAWPHDIVCCYCNVKTPLHISRIGMHVLTSASSYYLRQKCGVVSSTVK